MVNPVAGIIQATQEEPLVLSCRRISARCAIHPVIRVTGDRSKSHHPDTFIVNDLVRGIPAFKKRQTANLCIDPAYTGIIDPNF
jgi:hypothetical protein